MRALTFACVPLLCAVLWSCGSGDGPKTSGMPFEEFQAKLKALGSQGDVACEQCDRTGKVTNEDGERVACPKCGGKGAYAGTKPPTQREFEAALGKPAHTERKPGDLIWRYWHYPVKEGTAVLPVRRIEPRGDAIRVIAGQPELVK